MKKNQAFLFTSPCTPSRSCSDLLLAGFLFFKPKKKKNRVTKRKTAKTTTTIIPTTKRPRLNSVQFETLLMSVVRPSRSLALQCGRAHARTIRFSFFGRRCLSITATTITKAALHASPYTFATTSILPGPLPPICDSRRAGLDGQSVWTPGRPRAQRQAPLSALLESYWTGVSVDGPMHQRTPFRLTTQPLAWIELGRAGKVWTHPLSLCSCLPPPFSVSVAECQRLIPPPARASSHKRTQGLNPTAHQTAPRRLELYGISLSKKK